MPWPAAVVDALVEGNRLNAEPRGVSRHYQVDGGDLAWSTHLLRRGWLDLAGTAVGSSCPGGDAEKSID
jgi:hypothetical protein